MSRKRVGLSLSLFPFLAVLICTMGVLVALLLLVVKQADESSTREQAAAIADVAAEQSELELRSAEIHLRSQLLEGQRDERRREMANQRELLGHLESEMAALRAKAAEVAEQIRAVQATTQAAAAATFTEQAVAEQQRQLELLKEQLEIAKLAESVKAEANRRAAKPMYSIVPIAARSGTNRRPIYIECRNDGMYLYPGQIKLTLDDFVLPLTPGNPLDTALLAYREYWRKNPPSASRQDNAYPLLVVRPSGAKWYSVARRAMSGWDQEFGYELIPEDWQVNFGTADPGLVVHVEQAIAAARNRQTALVSYGQATPASQVGTSPPTSGRSGAGSALIPATGGGFSPAPTQPKRDRNMTLNSASSTFGNGPDPVASFSSQFQTDRKTGSAANAPASLEGSHNEQSSFLTSSRQTPTSPSFGIEPLGNAKGGASQRKTNSEFNGDATGPANQQSNQAKGSTNSRVANPAAATGSAGLPSAGMPTVAQDPSTIPSSLDEPVKSSAQNSPSTWNSDSMAHQRGADWALPSRRNAVSAYYRPVIVNVEADALVLPPGEGSPRSQTIPLGVSLSEAVDPLASAIWQRVDKWGYLGFDGYWKPVLELRFQPEHADKAVALQRMLEGSGLDVKLPETPTREAGR